MSIVAHSPTPSLVVGERVPAPHEISPITYHMMAEAAVRQARSTAAIHADLVAARALVIDLESREISERDTVRCLVRWVPGVSAAEKIAAITELTPTTSEDHAALIDALAVPHPA